MSSSPTVNFKPDGTLIIVSGPSGAGKTTLVNELCRFFEGLENPLHFSVSHTTRPPRTGEVDGVHYHFVDRDAFEEMVGRGEFIEHAHVHGHRYGTSRAEVERRLEENQDVILDIDVQGARIISENRNLKPRSVSVFVFPPSFDDLKDRLENRKQNSNDEIERRLQKAEAEILEGLSFYDYVIINDDLAAATECLKAAVIAKKLKTSYAMEKLKSMASTFKEENRAGIARRS
jgi:guanylate kinase